MKKEDELLERIAVALESIADAMNPQVQGFGTDPPPPPPPSK
ncbi:hypothetical protein [Sphingopyxis witflariensis]|nr:hypothetical protein [Sphingopyxis witflariensis]